MLSEQNTLDGKKGRIQDIVADLQGKVGTVGNAYAGGISYLKSRPSQLGLDLADTLRERAYDLAESIAALGDDLSCALRKRRRQARRGLQKQGRKLQKRSRELQKDWQGQLQQVGRKRTLWIGLGVGFGLTLAGVITYQFLRGRLQQLEEEEPALELPSTDVDLQSGIMTDAAPPKAVFVGVISTRLYYPIETPLDQLSMKEDLPADLVYFMSEQEARAEGFQPAPSHFPRVTSRP
jgi:uncharacterized protein YukE